MTLFLVIVQDILEYDLVSCNCDSISESVTLYLTIVTVSHNCDNTFQNVILYLTIDLFLVIASNVT